MLHLPKVKYLKWDKKAEKKILVGYTEDVNAYGAYDFKNNSVGVSRDVIVFENVKSNVATGRDDKKTEISENVIVSVSGSQNPPTEQNP